jgi:hypothetical protein
MPLFFHRNTLTIKIIYPNNKEGKNKIADVLYLRSRNVDENGNSILGICH